MNLRLFEPLPTPQEMAAWDKTAIEHVGIRQEVLMENASRECMAVLEQELGGVAGMSALVLAGPGNNGGDALALARHLVNKGALVEIYRTAPKSKYKGAAAYNLRLAEKLGIPMYFTGRMDPDGLPMADIVVDGLLGTGFNGALREEYAALVEAVNDMAFASFVLAVDIPSGLNGLTGQPSPVAVIADATVSFHAAKVGLAMPGAAEFTGTLYVGEIGIPRMVEQAAPPSSVLVTRKVFALLPAPDPAMHKGAAGHTLIAGGSPGLTGAPHLAALGALRGGVGLATAACPGALSTEVKSGSPDVMTMPLGDGRDWSAVLADALGAELERFDSLLIGPGMGRSQGARDFLRAVLDLDLPPLILDADGLYWPAKDPELLAKLPKGTILTPHPGEMARLLDTDTASVQNNRLEAARSMAGRTSCVVVLKGAGTVIAEPGGHTLITPIEAPNLAVGGTGDVLAGLMAALLAQGQEPVHAAALAVYWHAKTGEMLGESHPCRGSLASEVANALPKTIEEFKAC